MGCTASTIDAEREREREREARRRFYCEVGNNQRRPSDPSAISVMALDMALASKDFSAICKAYFKAIRHVNDEKREEVRAILGALQEVSQPASCCILPACDFSSLTAGTFVGADGVGSPQATSTVEFYPLEVLECPDHLDPDAIASELRDTASRKQSAVEDVKYWESAVNPTTGAPEPWRNGTDDSAITHPESIAREEERKKEAEAEDHRVAPTEEDHANLLHGCGISVKYLLYLTFELDLWAWKTWEVVQFLVKPLTESYDRCRFAHLPFVKAFTGPADVFMSHCWGGRWGDLVAAACTGASTTRFVWIDVFAVRACACVCMCVFVCVYPELTDAPIVPCR